jgi:hypothetical protein
MALLRRAHFFVLWSLTADSEPFSVLIDHVVRVVFAAEQDQHRCCDRDWRSSIYLPLRRHLHLAERLGGHDHALHPRHGRAVVVAHGEVDEPDPSAIDSSAPPLKSARHLAGEDQAVDQVAAG